MAEYFPGLDPALRQSLESFLKGYFEALASLTLTSQILEETANRRLIATLHPNTAKYLERRTKEELEAEKQLVAIAAGVSSAIRSALQEQPKS